MALCIEDIMAGDFVSEKIFISEDTVKGFAKVSGDYSPIHLDPVYANNTIFKKCIVHGMLIGAYFSKMIGMRLPGEGTIYERQSIEFLCPVYIGETVEIVVTVLDVNVESNRCTLSTKCFNSQGETAVTGEAVVLPPKKKSVDYIHITGMRG